MHVGRRATKRGGISGKREGRVFTYPLVGCVGSDFNVRVFSSEDPWQLITCSMPRIVTVRADTRAQEAFYRLNSSLFFFFSTAALLQCVYVNVGCTSVATAMDHVRTSTLPHRRFSQPKSSCTRMNSTRTAVSGDKQQAHTLSYDTSWTELQLKRRIC